MKALLLVVAFGSACVAPEDLPGDPSDYEEVEWSAGDGKADVSGVPVTFDRNLIMTDALLFAQPVDAVAVQRFFEHSPYNGTRSWLADYTINGRRFSDVLVEEAHTGGIDPVVLLARMQVEGSLVSKKPSATTLRHGLGCGCPDGNACSAAYAGMVNQLRCAMDVLHESYNESTSGVGPWELGHAKKTLDPSWVTPRTHATAALYAYTPWVLVGRGGNWLVWNVTRKFLKAFDQAGTLHLP